MLALLYILLITPAAALDTSAVILLNDREDVVLVHPHADLLLDSRRAWSLEDVTTPPLAARFERSRPGVPTFGYTRAALWLRFTVRNEAAAGTTWLLEITNKSIDLVDVYTVPEIPGFRSAQIGDGVPFSRRGVSHRRLAIPLPEHVNHAYTIYLRVASRGPLHVPVRILSQRAFGRLDRVEHLFLGAFFGILLVMAIYNLSLFAAIRDHSYLFYVAYILTYLAYQLSVERFGFQHLWPENVWWAERSNSFLALFCAIWAFQFSRSYLHTRDYAPTLDRSIAALAAACLPLMLLVVFGPRSIVNPTVAAVFIASPVLLLTAGLVCRLRGNKAADYYLLAWTFLLTGTGLGMLGNLGLLPQPLFGTRSIQLGSILEMTMLSLGLGYRYDALRRERERMRLRIATDLHDDIGTGLTQISLYSELTCRHTEGEGAEWARETGELARELTGRMQDIVWAVRPEASSWQSLEMRMKDWAARLLAPLGIEFDMVGEVEHGAAEFDIAVRKNVLMMFKEIIHNAVKHAGCSRVEVRYRASRDVLWLRLCDDGCGFDPATARRGNGLANLRHRADALHAELWIDTRPGGPTCYRIVIPLRHAGRLKADAARYGWEPPAFTPTEESPCGRAP